MFTNDALGTTTKQGRRHQPHVPTEQTPRVSNSSKEERGPTRPVSPAPQFPVPCVQATPHSSPPLYTSSMITRTSLLHAAGTGFPAEKGYFTLVINQLEDH